MIHCLHPSQQTASVNKNAHPTKAQVSGGSTAQDRPEGKMLNLSNTHLGPVSESKLSESPANREMNENWFQFRLNVI